MKLIYLSDGCFVASDEISEIKIHKNPADPAMGTINVRLKNGIGHNLSADLDKDITMTCARLVREINEANE
jgi:hypothetical protein